MRISGPKILLHAEGLAVLALACGLYRHSGGPWGRFALLFLAPDLSMAGYLLGPRAGAACYDAGHTYLAPALLGIAGRLAGSPFVFSLGLIWAAHIGFDRLLGYGLKYGTGFGDTHLGRV